jgi:hypothetical protein
MDAGKDLTPRKVLQVQSPDYEGPERRDTIFITQCECHAKHTRILDDHDGEIKGIKNDLKKGFQSLHDDLGHRREIIDKRIEASGRELWDETKVLERGKVSNRLFYTFITVYSVLFIGGIIAVYTGMHNNAITFTQGISEVKIMQTQTNTNVDNIKEDVNELKTEFKEYIKTNGNHK